MSEETSIRYVRLVEACAQPGCPVCRCVADDSRRYLDALLYEHVTDPDTRRAIRASWGFCNWHTWMLLEVDHAVFGASILYEDLVRLALTRTEHLAGRSRRPRRPRWLSAIVGGGPEPDAVESYRARTACPACASAADSEGRYLDTLVRSVDDADLRVAYQQSDGLCVPHLFTALETHGDRAAVGALVHVTRESWARVADAISRFLHKHDYRTRTPFTDDEAVSCVRAFEILAGRQSVFGNDVHARGAAPVASRGRRRSVTP